MIESKSTMPNLLYGTAWKKERTDTLVEQAIQIGFRGIDTACQPKHYDEKRVGVALARLKEQGIDRSSLYLQTKFTPLSGQDPSNVPYDKKAILSLQVEQSFNTSLNNLQTDYLDALLLHSPLPTFELTLDAWHEMERLHNMGGVQRLGISNCYDLALFEKLFNTVRVKPTILQNRFYKDTHYDKPLRQFCIEQGVTYQSFWTLTANPHILTSTVMQSLADDIKKTPAQLFFRFLIQSGITPLTGTCSTSHMKQDLDTLNFQLSNETMKTIRHLLT